MKKNNRYKILKKFQHQAAHSCQKLNFKLDGVNDTLTVYNFKYNSSEFRNFRAEFKILNLGKKIIRKSNSAYWFNLPSKNNPTPLQFEVDLLEQELNELLAKI